ncbi:flavodoxin [Poseidonibacter ostreae]|mgnify:CR=1 FL=1|jgi:flavodoxin I|uniref:Flavodoxin n=1 Tax=Poseidonibacter ostreae TaxID=2654171 RepID=A0A6L4WUQ7_9BACT|nr:flavodoxin [Poseidonibacter ostreae]KAB7881933.1 flavodoxin [Poseidonibacter ostreae]KAB7890330.1 flavodoxin [Poseidonibacter ostreae]KAB7890560.1 flavodoxin [Poseidonibacter ostreae]MAC85162.1 flavodoxin [Arcobacter sp.]|tara:strand:- start:525 stop:1022 length:498 start_codon:yes stop_codon:yes gene_type:complete
MSTALFYGSSTGNSEEIASKIASELGDIEVFDLSQTDVAKINDYKRVILGGSTWGEGELNDDWDEAWDSFKTINLVDKTLALFGLGDQDGYPDDFCNALGIIYEQVSTSGAKIVGFTSTEGYEFDDSKAEIDGKFVGLVIDEDNQDDLTDERIKNWVENIKEEIL